MSKAKPNWFIRFLRWLLPWKGDGFGEIIRKILFLIALIVFIGAAGYLGNYFVQRYISAQTAQQISDLYYNGSSDGDHIPLPDGYQQKFDNLYQINQDIKGWINIPDTKVDFPVVQGTDNDFYLHKNIYKKYDQNGVPFLDYRNELTQSTQSSNLVIYGHNMRFDGVFGGLVHYNDLTYYQNHPVITFDSVYKDMKWKIFAGFYVNTTPAEDNGNPIFDYQNYLDLTNKNRYNEFISQVLSRSVVKTNVDVKYGDKLLTLSTCANEFKDGRFVVVARLVRDGEDENVDVSKAVYNPNPVYPAIWHK